MKQQQFWMDKGRMAAHKENLQISLALRSSRSFAEMPAAKSRSPRRSGNIPESFRHN
jgi:hypothetical protein